MSPSRRGDPGGSRSADERERDRRERERRRARREGGEAGGDAGDPFDILATGVDPTISRPPDLDWPPERADVIEATAASQTPWSEPREGPAVAVPERHLVFDPATGYQKFVSVEPDPAPITAEPGEAVGHP